MVAQSRERVLFVSGRTITCRKCEAVTKGRRPRLSRGTVGCAIFFFVEMIVV